MSNNFTMTKNYADAQLLLADDLQQMGRSLETFVNVTGVTDDNIQPAGIIGDNINPLSVVTASLASNSITTDKIADTAVTSAKINDGAVTTVKIIDGVVTRDKLEAVGQQTSDFTTVVSGASITTLASKSITTTGRPVYITVPAQPYLNAVPGIGDNSFSQGKASPTTSSTAIDLNFDVFIFRGSTQVYRTNIQVNSHHIGLVFTTDRFYRVPTGGIQFIDQPGAGTYTYNLKMQLNDTTYNGQTKAELFVYEL